MPSSPSSARRLFAGYAALTAVPVVAMGALLVSLISTQANARGLAEGRTEAAQIAQTTVAPLVAGRDLHAGLSTAERASLTRVIHFAGSGILRLRLRTLDGLVIFSGDGSGLGAGADGEVLEAAGGHVVSFLTWLNHDANDRGPRGQRVVEVYEPLQSAQTHARIGVLELYLPYAPIAEEITTDRRTLTVALGSGLVALWLMLLLVAVSVTRRLRREARRNAYLAAHDTITGLPNRSSFHERVRKAISTATTDNPAAIAVIDLDRFKEVNDTLGHRNGDQLLARLATRLSGQVRAGDTVARLGGDEFGIVLSQVHGPGEAVEILTRLRNALATPVELGGLPVAVEASVGFVLAPDDGDDAGALLQRADLAMYAAKRGHLAIARHRREQDQYDATTLALVGAMRAAIDGDQLVLHFQPKESAQTGRVTGVEALVRWNHPTRGLLYPDLFLPAVEQTELIEPLTRWVLREAAAALSRIDPTGPLKMAVNISARSLIRTDFAAEMLSILDDSGTDPSRITLEITETALLTDPARTGRNLKRLTDAGIGISIDDFGAGQTSLGHLATLPICELKIDKSFVLTMVEDERNAAIVRSVIQLGHSLGFVVTAEGVETTQARDALVGARCDTVQGYLLSPPVTESAFREYLEAAPHAAHVGC